jgi:asparagine synthase (glutamine-hydrolysing)
MCGINGIVNLNHEDVNLHEIQLMMDQQKHRGPDDEGVFLCDKVGLGFVRLSILDLSPAGHQPMHSHDNRYIIVFNGEVYNYIEIKEELETEFLFKTGTDTEVILAAYQKWGSECLDKFNGMFTFAIYDTQTQTIFAARDRFGIKPFYYYQDSDRFIFASEIKSILPLVKKEENDKMIFDYLLYNRTDHTEETFFKGINKLKHGYYLTIKGKNVNIEQWYNLTDRIEKNKELTPEQYRDLFKDSLRLRLRADVPIGVSLSGGIDSSAIVSSLIKDFDIKGLNTFSAVYGKDEPSDESEFIDEFSSMVKNMHYTYPSADSFFEDFNSFITAHNEPVPDIGPYAQYKVMELASKDVTVTLDGQGADEQLAGYHYFFGSYYRELVRNFKFKRLLHECISYRKKHSSLKAIQYLLYYILPTVVQTKANRNAFPSVNKYFIKKNWSLSTISKSLHNPKSLNESLYQHFESKLEHLLKWEDLNAMHFSIESRVPFLDYRLVEATLSTPSEQKINMGETKHILREALKDILPEKITNRKDKKGFTNPRDKWFKTEQFKRYILDLLNSESFNSRKYFDRDIALSQYELHLKGKIDASKEIWKWINLEVWFREFIDIEEKNGSHNK